MPVFLNNRPGLPSCCQDIIEKHFDVITPDDLSADAEKGKKAVGILMFSLSLKIMQQNLDQLSNVRVLSSIGVGVERFKPVWDQFWSQGIRFSRGIGVQDKACADMIWTLLLGSAKHVVSGMWHTAAVISMLFMLYPV